MKRKIKSVKKITNKKIILYLLAAFIGISNTNVVSANNNVTIENVQQDEIDGILENMYQQQMQYLYDTICELKEFYKFVDTDDIIKTSYKNAYDIVNYNFNCDIISNGTNEKFFKPRNPNPDYLNLIKENNRLIMNLNIRPNGNGRNPDYGIIKDDNSPMGFRAKTEKDYELINKYSTILGNEIIFSDDLLKLLSKDKLEITDNDLINGLESILNDQINYIYNVQNKMKDFLSKEDNKNLIESCYPIVYTNLTNNVIKTDYNGVNYSIYHDSNKSNIDLIKEYLEQIKYYNEIIYSFNIRPNGNGRNPDYGIIKDDNSPMGFRAKTEKDYQIINEYSDILGDFNPISYEIINYLENLSNNYELGKTL